MKKIALLLMFIVAPVLLLTGCGEKTAEKVLENALEADSNSEIDVDLENDSFTITDEDGNFLTTESTGDLPDGYPEKIDYYSKDIISSSKLSTDDGVMYSLIMETNDEPSEVATFYKDFFIDKSWELSMDLVAAETTMLVGLNGEEMSLTITASVEESVTTVGHTLTVNN